MFSYSQVLGDGVKSCIIDTEAVAWDREKKQILPFQILSTRKRKVIFGLYSDKLISQWRRGNFHPRRPRGSQSGRAKWRDESFQERAQELLRTFLKTFVAPFRPARPRTALRSPRIEDSQIWCDYQKFVGWLAEPELLS